MPVIRPYEPADDPALMALERQSARGFPNPFVHFRRQFIDRANLYRNAFTLVAEKDNAIIGVSSICVKDTLIGNHQVQVAYSFDTRVAPKYRRNGIGHQMVEAKLQWAKEQGAVGVYSLIVTTNDASLSMVAKSGYKKMRGVLYMLYHPYPMLSSFVHDTLCHYDPPDADLIYETYSNRDLYVENIFEQVKHLDFERWTVTTPDGRHAGISLYNQAKVYLKIPADSPFPKTDAEIERLGRNLQLFDALGMEHPDLMHALFDRVRDEAVTTRVNKLVWMLDRNEVIPPFLFDAAYQQTDYWLMYKSFDDSIHLNWQDLVYLDPRDL